MALKIAPVKISWRQGLLSQRQTTLQQAIMNCLTAMSGHAANARCSIVTIMEPSMESCRVAEERDWDFRRLQDIRPSTERTVYGTIIDPLLSLVTSTYHSNAGIGYTRQVVAAMSPRILHCKCVRQLIPHLARRQVVAASVSTYILSQADSEAARSLEKLLKDHVSRQVRPV